MKKIIFSIGLLVLSTQMAQAFCGFYVAKADAKLFNKTSQVILVRDGDKTIITMSNDYEGPVKDFAMVVPVPVVLKEKQIRTVPQSLFDDLDAYSAPRIVEYWDDNPCYVPETYPAGIMYSFSSTENYDMVELSAINNGVTIEAQYKIDEYDVLILSAKESDGLKTWLTANGYKLPEGASKVLDPYIQNGMKFFVAKVNLEDYDASGNNTLNPLQIEFNSDKFMLPIRLGMANAKSTQDLLVYAFTKTGRIETTNYRQVSIPTDNEIPLFVQDEFGQFYKDVFERVYNNEGRNAVFLEYAWDLSTNNPVKCDPCISPPPPLADMSQVGVGWANEQGSKVYFTRLHVRYDEANFPQDLQFQVTPNQERFQGRYVTRHMAQGDLLACDEGVPYLEGLLERRKNELDELASLTGWDVSNRNDYTNKVKDILKKAGKEVKEEIKETENEQDNVAPLGGNGSGPGSGFPLWLALLAGAGLTVALVTYALNKRGQKTLTITE